MQLSVTQRLFLRMSGTDARPGYSNGVELWNAGNWRTARSLVALGLGTITGGGKFAGTIVRPHFFANSAGLDAVARKSQENCE